MFLPRLIEVTATGRGALHFRVVLTRCWREKEKYISSSHRWGDIKAPKLTLATFGVYQKFTPANLLPQKFIFAGEVAVRMGIKYLWIDSRCIIQDWAKYWEEESVQLHQVYRQSFCYLSAASADLNDDGLFYHGRDLALRHPNFAYPRHQDQPLYSLSWVFQERLLSTRSISLTKNLGFFERARGLTCDTRDLARAILSDWLAPDETQRLRSVMSFFTGNQISLTNAGGVEVRITTTVPHGRDALGRVRAGGSSLRLLCAVALLTLEAPGWPAVEEALASLCRFRERWMHFCSGFDRNEDEPGDTLVRCYSVAPLFYAREEPPPDEEHIWDSHFIPLNALEPCKLAWGVYRRVGIVHVRIPYEPPDRGLEYEPPALPEDDEELPAVCRQSQACRLRPELCRFLGYVLKAAREAGIPFCGIEPDGRRITTII